MDIHTFKQYIEDVNTIADCYILKDPQRIGIEDAVNHLYERGQYYGGGYTRITNSFIIRLLKYLHRAKRSRHHYIVSIQLISFCEALIERKQELEDRED